MKRKRKDLRPQIVYYATDFSILSMAGVDTVGFLRKHRQPTSAVFYLAYLSNFPLLTPFAMLWS